MLIPKVAELADGRVVDYADDEAVWRAARPHPTRTLTDGEMKTWLRRAWRTLAARVEAAHGAAVVRLGYRDGPELVWHKPLARRRRVT